VLVCVLQANTQPTFQAPLLARHVQLVVLSAIRLTVIVQVAIIIRICIVVAVLIRVDVQLENILTYLPIYVRPACLPVTIVLIPHFAYLVLVRIWLYRLDSVLMHLHVQITQLLTILPDRYNVLTAMRPVMAVSHRPAIALVAPMRLLS
jgi:hypothetical protein